MSKPAAASRASRTTRAGASEHPKRGELWWTALDPTRGREQAGRRPALVLSADLFNASPAGPVSVLAAWLALVFIPAAFRLQALYAAIALLSVVAFALSFHLSARLDLHRMRAERRRLSSESMRSHGAEPAAAPSAGIPTGPADLPDDGDARFRVVLTM